MPVEKCVYCDKRVTQGQHALKCDECGRWTHRTCESGVGLEDYRSAVRGDLEIEFICSECAPEDPGQPVTESTRLSDYSRQDVFGNFSVSLASVPSSPIIRPRIRRPLPIDDSDSDSYHSETDHSMVVDTLDATFDLTSRSFVAVEVVQEESLNDTPVHMPTVTSNEDTTQFPIINSSTQRSKDKLVDSSGFTYTLKGTDVLEKAGGLHKFMNWDRCLLTDSGGFQMVSLLKLAEITEEGVKFQSPHDGSEMMLTPEKSIEIQNSIGADIIMQLDDVVHSCVTGPRVEEAMYRTIRWLDRCLKAHKRPHDQSIFPIVQGGLYPDLRKKCAEELVKRDVPGFAIGGLSGGEEKSQFWKMVTISTDVLPKDKPRYLMGVGFAVDLVVCVALGCDMFDCVYPTRTARFGSALVPSGILYLKNKSYAQDFQPIDEKCRCSTCQNYSRAYLHTIVQNETVACQLLTVHNVAYQLNLMRDIQQSIIDNRFPAFIKDFFIQQFPNKDYPEWAVDALNSVNVHLNDS